MKESELHTRAVLVRFRSRYWDGTITDRAITQKTNRELEMRRDQGKYRKQIFCRDDLEKLRKAYSEIKQYYYERTLPWEDRGPRLLATSAFETFTVYMNRGINTYQELVQDIPGQYQTWVENARTALGRPWNPADYPAISTVMRKFHAGLQFFTIPNVEDLRINLAEDQKKMLQEQMEEGTRSMFQKAMKDCWQRMYEVVDRMVESLEAYPQRTFKDSLVGSHPHMRCSQALIGLLAGLTVGCTGQLHFPPPDPSDSTVPPRPRPATPAARTSNVRFTSVVLRLKQQPHARRR